MDLVNKWLGVDLSKAAPEIGDQELTAVVRRGLENNAEEFARAIADGRLREIVAYILAHSNPTVRSVAGNVVAELVSHNRHIPAIVRHPLAAFIRGFVQGAERIFESPNLTPRELSRRMDQSWANSRERREVEEDEIIATGVEHWTNLHRADYQCSVPDEHRRVRITPLSMLRPPYRDRALCTECFPDAARAGGVVINFPQPPAPPPAPPSLPSANADQRRVITALSYFMRLRMEELIDWPTDFATLRVTYERALQNEPRVLELLPTLTAAEAADIRNACEAARALAERQRRLSAERRRLSGQNTPEGLEAAAAQQRGDPVLTPQELNDLMDARTQVRQLAQQHFAAFLEFARVEGHRDMPGTQRTLLAARDYANDMMTDRERERVRDVFDRTIDRVSRFVNSDVPRLVGGATRALVDYGHVAVLMFIVGFPMIIGGTIGIYLPGWIPLALWTIYFVLFVGLSVILWWRGGSLSRRMGTSALLLAFAGVAPMVIVSIVLASTDWPWIRVSWMLPSIVGAVFIIAFSVMVRLLDSVINAIRRIAVNVSQANPGGFVNRMWDSAAQVFMRTTGIELPEPREVTRVGGELSPVQAGRDIATICTLITGVLVAYNTWMFTLDHVARWVFTALGYTWNDDPWFLMGLLLVTLLSVWLIAAELHTRWRFFPFMESIREGEVRQTISLVNRASIWIAALAFFVAPGAVFVGLLAFSAWDTPTFLVDEEPVVHIAPTRTVGADPRQAKIEALCAKVKAAGKTHKLCE